MINATQKLLVKTDRSTLSLLIVPAALGSRQHRLLFVHRRDGVIVAVEDYDFTQTRFLTQDLMGEGETLISQHSEEEAPESRCKVKTVTSSDGDFYLEFLAEHTAIKKVSGGYEVLRQTNQPQTGQPDRFESAAIVLA
ncbi:hypothetical protein NIES2135_53840 [Leptolyngbya boryana NIES-2135]|jgi:hypothetical protein|uniref:Uncharacterized protein n=1 Tax=Leptolyngbya boryana NIES-2135 TaxID=1973484 RepID=A0A1Z4JP26_LEPBY|nr:MULTISPECIES: hypothetical protein [Leptolyngbya]BAY58511.1 hypothetical protein NIES2135_53840 [Leptolyngbya boryana NIES-2135]MBD2370986.1 hypothetical protein [Leptolyngbya sp. FACHB-161]MBD2377500.1 hypothetical protein [Leptolyngbya sp. FACHB-238]MBD2401909.1 hypothetical protein [Leptolyngbya sp. FACHB-239]MBD2408426.1 hypothetical protein [Leptolyngbya sp. FACHB-402]